MKDVKNDKVRQEVRKSYGDIANADTQACCSSGCGCGDATSLTAEEMSVQMGYSPDDVQNVPKGANMGLGCGNPQAIASLQKGEIVLDLGSGGGFDCFLAAKAVGTTGHVIGVDMTPDMISKARANAEEAELNTVEFRLGEIEHLPVADNAVDVIMSNCVINLSPDKLSVFKEAFRILKSKGRLAISDIVATAEMPDEMKSDLQLYSGCVAGAALIADVESMLAEAGFENISITTIPQSKESIKQWFKDSNVADYVISSKIEATKP